MNELRHPPDDISVPVLIVGAGPVGLALAIELGRAGVKCLVVEQSDGHIDHPRASALNSRTMEFCRRWGIAEKVRAVGTPPDFPHTVLYLTSLTGHELCRIERSEHGGGAAALSHTPERPQRCNQLWLDPILHETARGLPSVALRHRARFASLSESTDGIEATIENLDGGRPWRVSADYLVACCGGRSTIPAALGVTMDDASILSHSVNIFFRCPELWRYHDKGPAALNLLVGPEGQWGGLTAQDGRELWRVTIHGSKQDLDPDAVDPDVVLRRVMGRDFDYEIISVMPWTRRSWVAPTYHGGRVFLAGDAAHQNSPTGGFGLNTGMGDAVDLGWKLVAAVRGWAGTDLLASYEAERRPVALRNVGEATNNYSRYALPDTTAIEDATPEGAALRTKIGAVIKRNQTRQFRSEGIALGYRYDPSPIVWPDGSAAPPDDASTYVPTARPGSRAPHAWLADGRSILDLYDDGFALLQFGDGSPDPAPFADAARIRGVPLTVIPVESPEIRELYECTLVLVRPDGHVAWRGDTLPGDPLAVIDGVRGA